MLEVADTAPLQRALALAQQALYLTPPNPRVGCVLIAPDGRIIGQGHTQAVGGPHAEVMALRDAAAHGHSPRGATAYVTLEPCSHYGRTPPCALALIEAGVARVVALGADPNPQVAGQGFERLRAAGVTVEVSPQDDPLVTQAIDLNIGFFSRMTRQQPWVRVKLAASLDGQMALANGVSQWITGPEARADGHTWRARACAILTGVGTLLADQPRLDVRAVSTPRQPRLVVLDSQARTPVDAPVFIAARACLICVAADFDGPIPAWPKNVEVLRLARAAGVVGAADAPATGLALQDLLHELARREVNELHVEAGPTLSTQLIASGLADELLLYMAPKLIGPGRGLYPVAARSTLEALPSWSFHQIDRVGDDLRLLLRRADSA